MGVCFSCEFGEEVVLNHYTDSYKWSDPVFRRGWKFILNASITANINSFKTKRMSCIELKSGESNPHCIRFKDTSETIEGWKVKYQMPTQTQNTIKFKITSPADAIVGSYVISIYFGNVAIASQKFVMVFNPWNRLDDVFLPLEEMRKEYVENQNTMLYVGTTATIESRPWILGQFETDSIAAVLYLMDRIPADLRRSAKAVSRSLSALVNSNDDMGVLCGSWDGKYADGTSPTAWVSSVDILRKYHKTKSPVKYGQCWVFSGTLATVCRTMGIPCRCITNFESFHDNDGTHAWELYLDGNMNIIDISSESVWNYHCWNEVWIMDQVKEYSGWQVIDATPQERSAGIYRCGPAPKYAIKNGILNADYDVGFVFAEVNAKKVFFVKQSDGSFKKSMEKAGDIGKLVATKKMGTNELENITEEYKMVGSNEMRAVSDARECQKKMANVKIDCEENLNVGSPFKFAVELTETKKGLKVRIVAFLVSYRGRVSEKLHDITKSVSADFKYDKVIDGSDIAAKAGTEFSTIKVMVILMDGNTAASQEEKLVNLIVPQIKIMNVPTVATLNTTINAQVQLVNPFSYALTNVKVYLNSDALEKRQKTEISELKPGECITQTIPIQFTRIGATTLTASMDANEGGGFNSSVEVNVKE